MTRVARHLAYLNRCRLDDVCDFGMYLGRTWREILRLDLDWVLWLLVDSNHLLDHKLESELQDAIRRGLT